VTGTRRPIRAVSVTIRMDREISLHSGATRDLRSGILSCNLLKIKYLHSFPHARVLICHFGTADADGVSSTSVERSNQRACAMKSSGENNKSNDNRDVRTMEVAQGVVNWVASSIFGLAGTVLLVCWLLAYATEPTGWFARIGLMLALGAYGVDLAREKWAGWREEHQEQGAGAVQAVRTPTPRAVKAA